MLLLDEPGEHLDIATADALTADLLTATEGRTTLLVTHRLAGLDAVDEIVVLTAAASPTAAPTPPCSPAPAPTAPSGSASRPPSRPPNLSE